MLGTEIDSASPIVLVKDFDCPTHIPASLSAELPASTVAEETMSNRRGDRVHLLRRVAHSRAASPKGSALLLLFAHGTGLPKELWLSVMNRLLVLSSASVPTPEPDLVLVGMDMSRMGHSAVLNQHAQRHSDAESILDIYRDDIVDVAKYLTLQECRESEVILIGHSAGATAALEASIALARDAAQVRVRSVVAIEPIMFPSAGVPPSSAEPEHIKTLKSVTRRRRKQWPSTQAIRKAYSVMAPFKGWTQEQMDILIDFAFIETQTGVLRSKTSPETEMNIYNNWQKALPIYSERFVRFPSPLLLISGIRSDIFPPALAALAADQPQGTQVFLQTLDAGHMLIGSHAEQLSNYIHDFMQKDLSRAAHCHACVSTHPCM